ncbi:MAG: PadR family transcriptional regulator [Roseiflexaceae bacterium]
MTIRNTILGLIAQRARHGYDLHAAFEALAGGADKWSLKPAQVYTTLDRLAASGLIAVERIEQDGGPEKQIYAITPSGRAELARWLLEPLASQHQRDAFFLKLMLSMATELADPVRVIRVQRMGLFQELHQITRQRSQLDGHQSLAMIMLFDRAAMHLEADLRWLEMLEARIDELRQQPLPTPIPRQRGRPPKGSDSPAKE